MKLMGFNFTKINAEKYNDQPETLKIDQKINILEMNSSKQKILASRDDFLDIKFNYEILYGPEFAKIVFEGRLLLAVESNKIKEILKSWEEKIIPEEFKIGIFNVILKKSNIKAIQLEDELGLPLHLPLPSLKRQVMPEKE